MKRIHKIGMIALLALLVLLLAASCTAEDSGTDGERPAYDGERLSEYLEPVVYESLTVSLSSDGASKSEAIWDAILSGARVNHYPEEQVAYYETQLRAEYRYLAEQEGRTYENLLELLGVDDASISEDAREMVKADLVFLSIVRDAGIVLTEREKTELFDRYVEKYVEDYGYGADYVRSEMAELIYESMLYDKTTEYLILHNEFVTEG